MEIVGKQFVQQTIRHQANSKIYLIFVNNILLLTRALKAMGRYYIRDKFKASLDEMVDKAMVESLASLPIMGFNFVVLLLLAYWRIFFERWLNLNISKLTCQPSVLVSMCSSSLGWINPLLYKRNSMSLKLRRQLSSWLSRLW